MDNTSRQQDKKSKQSKESKKQSSIKPLAKDSQESKRTDPRTEQQQQTRLAKKKGLSSDSGGPTRSGDTAG